MMIVTMISMYFASITLLLVTVLKGHGMEVLSRNMVARKTTEKATNKAATAARVAFVKIF
ncbi:hypothetical protein CFP56_005944 [Quercus suber]|uniref:Uncharacterized protein n=1 Tax=Quercus suber TaxID=58331 RepID=A0AAW0M9H7_QUESU